MVETIAAAGVRVRHPDGVEVRATGVRPAAGGRRGMRAPQSGPSELTGALAAAGFDVQVQIELVPQRGGTRALRATPEAPTAIDVDLAPNESAVVLVESNGVYAWKLPNEPTEGPPGSGRRAASRTVRFDLSPPQGPPRRPGMRGGEPEAVPQARRSIVTDWIADAVVDPIRAYVLKFVANAAIDVAMDFIEGDKPTGLTVLGGQDPTKWRPGALPRPALVAGRPARLLMMVHGTFSSTEGSFGQLTASDTGRSFLGSAANKYDAIIGFDHKTLMEDPAANVTAMQRDLQLLEIPEGSMIDAVAFSRGGLVYRNWAETILPQARPDLKLGKAIFVACTNAGTLLAEPENWTAMIELYTNIAMASTRALQALGVGGVTASAVANEVIKTAGRFVQALAQQVIAANRVPGLAAMRPTSEFVASLNKAKGSLESLAQYYAITSNFVARLDMQNGFTRQLAEFVIDRVTNRLFKTNNDLVVDTASMLEFGTRGPRHGDAVFDFGSTDDVYHTVYFSQDKVASRLRDWLELPAAAAAARTVRREVPSASPIPESPSGPPPAGSWPSPASPRAPSEGARSAPYVGKAPRPPPPPAMAESAPPQRRAAPAEPGPAEPVTARVRAEPPRATCNFAAQMDPYPELKKAAPLEVEISRERIALVEGTAAKKRDNVVVDTARKMIVEVIARANCRVETDTPDKKLATTTSAEIDVPQPEQPAKLRFMVHGVEAGPADILVEARQGPRILVSFELKPVFVETGADKLRVTATASVRESSEIDRHVVMRIYEINLGNQVSLKFNLDCDDPNINVSVEQTLPVGLARESFVDARYQEIEQAWIADSTDFDKFTNRLRASGIDMADGLLPPEVREALWTHRHAIKAVQVISDEPYIPWELLYLTDPRSQDSDKEGFLAEFGLVRWLHNTSWPPVRFPLGSKRVYSVIPEYPDNRYSLPGAAAERRVLRTLFDGAVEELQADSLAVTAFLGKQPDVCEVLHFACHGDTTQRGFLNADLMMAGRMIGTQYQRDLLSDKQISASARFATPGIRPIVFVNACRVGQTGQTIAGAGGFAKSFLRPKSQQGAGIFVGALWSIGDTTALTFAETFYRALLDGETLVAATTAARDASKKDQEFTWLAYTVYGDPFAKAAPLGE